MSAPHYFGIRHHGPGCARSLLQAFEELKPDCVLIEGPPEADGLLRAVGAEGMQPPVALLSYCPDTPRLAVYHPFAEFSPEWQAIRWALAAGVPVRFIDLPLVHGLALDQAKREALQAGLDGEKPSTLEVAGDAAKGEGPGDEPGASRPAADPASLPRLPEAESASGVAVDAARQSRPDPTANPAPEPVRGDPLNWLAHAAGYSDGEAWWNHMVEERGDGEQLFAAIAEAMTTLRAEAGDTARDADEAQRELWREAHMRQCIRAAQKEGHARIAVVCGAWHLGGLQNSSTAKADQALLKGLPKLKVQSTWVPWTYRHLARASGYGAGIQSPGWYEHLWHSHGRPQQRAAGWLARVARLMRERELDCSSAHLIEATRLADALAALRDRPAPGLDELNEAARAVLTLGDESALAFIHDALVVGDRLGQVPSEVPVVPLQRDLEQLQKSLRLKPEALQKTLDLDLRQPNDLARSHLLHRLQLLDLPWGRIAKVGRSARGTFHEVWTLQWQPEFALRLIEASLWGQTVEQAATARVAERCRSLQRLDELAELVDTALLADLDAAVAAATQALEDRAALSGDVPQLLAALPPLANVFRYGNVRQTDAALVGHVLDGLILRAAIGLPLSATAIDDAAAETLRGQVLAADAAVRLRQGEAQTEAWQQALERLAHPRFGADAQASRSGPHELIQGLATRLLLDADRWPSAQAARAMSLHLSAAAEPLRAAAWLDGFLNRNAVVLLHDPAVWQLVDDWVADLGDEHFVRVLPLLRRTFSVFAGSERRELGARARQGAQPAAATALDARWDEARAAWPLPLLRQLLGMNP